MLGREKCHVSMEVNFDKYASSRACQRALRIISMLDIIVIVACLTVRGNLCDLTHFKALRSASFSMRLSSLLSCLDLSSKFA